MGVIQKNIPFLISLTYLFLKPSKTRRTSFDFENLSTIISVQGKVTFLSYPDSKLIRYVTIYWIQS